MIQLEYPTPTKWKPDIIFKRKKYVYLYNSFKNLWTTPCLQSFNVLTLLWLILLFAISKGYYSYYFKVQFLAQLAQLVPKVSLNFAQQHFRTSTNITFFQND